ncbi:MAG: hypothetical protein ACKVH0_14480, partial [Alphaproteobacteria bacterium]
DTKSAPGVALRFGIHRGIEFTHKSFAEFLYVRHLLRQAQMVVATQVSDLPKWLSCWGMLSGEYAMSPDTLSLLRDELHRGVVAKTYADETLPSHVAWRDKLRPMLERALADGIAMQHSHSNVTPRDAARWSVNAEEALFVVVHAHVDLASAAETGKWRISWPDTGGVTQFLRRIV